MKRFALVVLILLSLALFIQATGQEEVAGQEDKQASAALPAQILYGSSAKQASSWFPAHVKMAELGDRGMPKTSVTVVFPGGSVIATQTVFDGEQHVAGGSMLALYEAFHGMGKWEGKPLPNRVRVMYYYTDCPNPIAVRSEKAINSVSDLKGGKVFLGYPGSTTNAQHLLAFDALGIEYEEYVGSLSDAVPAFKDRRIDAFIKSTNGHGIDATHRDILTSTPIRFIGFTDSEVKKIQDKYERVKFIDFPADWYDDFSMENPIKIINYALIVIARDDLPEELAYQWTKSIVENWDEVGAVFPGAAAITPLDTPKLLLPDVYMHSGSIRYMRERGIDVPESAVPPEMK